MAESKHMCMLRAIVKLSCKEITMIAHTIGIILKSLTSANMTDRKWYLCYHSYLFHYEWVKHFNKFIHYSPFDDHIFHVYNLF